MWIILNNHPSLATEFDDADYLVRNKHFYSIFFWNEKKNTNLNLILKIIWLNLYFARFHWFHKILFVWCKLNEFDTNTSGSVISGWQPPNVRFCPTNFTPARLTADLFHRPAVSFLIFISFTNSEQCPTISKRTSEYTYYCFYNSWGNFDW